MLVLVTLLSLCYAECTLKDPGFYEVDQVMSCINSVPITEDWNQKVVASMREYLDAYVYKDILKNPPQVDGKDYFPKVDLDDKLDAIDTTNLNFYEQYQKFVDVVKSTYDQQLTFSLKSISETVNYYIDNIEIGLPFIISMKSQDTYYFKINSLIYDNYPDWEATELNDIKEHDGHTVTSVNGQSPYEFVKSFAEKHTYLK